MKDSYSSDVTPDRLRGFAKSRREIVEEADGRYWRTPSGNVIVSDTGSKGWVDITDQVQAKHLAQARQADRLATQNSIAEMAIPTGATVAGAAVANTLANERKRRKKKS